VVVQVLVSGVLFAAACSDDPPSFPEPATDAGIECTGPLPGGGGGPSDGGMDASAPREMILCPGTRVCLQGRCYPPCEGDQDCALTEMCSASGVCVTRTEPRRDAGPMIDAGPADPCEGVECTSPTPSCHPITGECVECQSSSECVPGSVCDIGSGVCRTFAPGPCAPCDTDAQCTDPSTMMSVGTCTMLDADFERVCVPTCTMMGECPTGLACDTDRGLCLPQVGTCSGFYAATQDRMCTEDEDCVPFGSIAADGQCAGAVAGDGGMPGTCRQPCGIPSHCPSGTTCIEGFCQPS